MLWNVRVCDLPDGVAEACRNLSRSGRWPRPEYAGGYERAKYTVSAFPVDESEPLRDRLVRSRPHVGQAVDTLLAEDVRYILVWADPDG